MCALDRLHVQIQTALVLPDGGVAAVGQRAGRPVAESRNVVLIPAEVGRLCFDFIGAMAMVDDLPHNLNHHQQPTNVVTILS